MPLTSPYYTWDDRVAARATDLLSVPQCVSVEAGSECVLGSGRYKSEEARWLGPSAERSPQPLPGKAAAVALWSLPSP